MTVLGVALFAASAAYLAWVFFRVPRRHPYRAYGVVGLLLLAAAAILLALKVRVVMVFCTPIVWTGYILAIDAAVFSLRGRSLLANHRAEFAWMALLSIPLWLVFEAYNLRLQNWTYVGLPGNALVRTFGYLWSFATIWPAMLETTEFLLAGWFRDRPGPSSQRFWRGLPALGGCMVVVPLLLPPAWGSYLFGLVWLGFGFLLDPLNCRARRASIVEDLGQGRRARLWALLTAGVICGFVWEFWNFWASARWLYVFPILQSAKIFEMPAPGYLGFPAFAVEVFAMYVYVTGRLRVPYYEVQ